MLIPILQVKQLRSGKVKLQTHHLTTNEGTAQVSLTLKPRPKAITWFVPGQIPAEAMGHKGNFRATCHKPSPWKRGLSTHLNRLN